MQDYRRFEPEALAADPSFQRWQLFDDPADGALWTDWVRQNPDQEELVEKAAHLLKTVSRTYEQRLEEDVPLSDREVQAEIRRLHRAIHETDDSRTKWYQLTPVRYGMAASLLILLGLFGWHTYQPAASKQAVTYRELVTSATSPLSEVVNVTSKPLRIDLPDGSTVTLYPSSRVSYDKRFLGVRRDVYLSGKANFNVVKNPSKPFYVYAHELVTKVLGTRFTVQAYEGNKQVKVAVRTGRVSVFVPDQDGVTNLKGISQLAGVVLTPNQQLVFSSAETRLVKSLVEQPVRLDQSAPKQALTFKRTPIADVFAALGQAYGIRIVFDEGLMRNCYLTASLSDEPLFAQLDLICRTVNARYAQSDGSVIISSNGCGD